MKVILSANIPHYFYTALALQKAGYLWRYVTSIGIRDDSAGYMHVLSAYRRSKLKSRSLSGLRPELVRTIWWPELIQKCGIRSGLIPVERANWLNNHLYDRLARRWVEPCEVFHFVSSIGLYSARKAKANGSLTICDERTEYPDFQREILRDEYDYLGITYNPPGLSYDAKIKAEYEIADYLILPSHYAKRTFIEAGFDQSKIWVIPYGVDVHFFSPEELGPDDPEDTTFRIIYAGQVIPRKGVHYLIRAFEQLALPNSELLIAGRVDNTMAPIVHDAASRNCCIRVLGIVPKSRLRELYRLSSVFVLPSLADSWGLVCAEAMACGLPVIVTDNAGSREMVLNGENGFVVPIRSAEAIAAHLQYLYHNRATGRHMGLSARSQALQFTWERYRSSLLEAYRGIGGKISCEFFR